MMGNVEVDRRDYDEYYKAEIEKKLNVPYELSNSELAKNLFAFVVKDHPEARLIVLNGLEDLHQPGHQWICCTPRAVKKVREELLIIRNTQQKKLETIDAALNSL